MIENLVLCFFPGIMIFCAISDLSTMTISNRVTLALAVGFFPAAFLLSTPLAQIGWNVAAALLVLFICYFLFELGFIGGGDGKLAAATALWFGFTPLPEYGVVTALLGGVVTIFLIAFRKVRLPDFLARQTWLARLHAPTSGVPYGVALALAGLMIYPNTSIWQAALSSAAA